MVKYNYYSFLAVCLINCGKFLIEQSKHTTLLYSISNLKTIKFICFIFKKIHLPNVTYLLFKLFWAIQNVINWDWLYTHICINYENLAKPSSRIFLVRLIWFSVMVLLFARFLNCNITFLLLRLLFESFLGYNINFLLKTQSSIINKVRIKYYYV